MTLNKLKVKDISIKILLIFIAVCPIFYLATKQFGWQTLRVTQEQMFQFGTTVLVGVFLIENIYLASLLLLSCFLYAYYNFPANGGNIVLNTLLGCLLYQLTYRVANRQLLHTVKKVILWLLFADILYMVIQAMGWEFIYLSHSSRNFNDQLVGLFGLKSVHGMFMALCVPFVANRRWWMALPLLLPIGMTESASSFGCACVLISIQLFRQLRLKRVVVIGAMIVMTITALIYAAVDAREQFWKDKLNLWKVVMKDAVKQPLTGWGLDSFRSIGSFKPFMYFKNPATEESAKFQYHKETNSFVPPAGFVKEGGTVDPWDHPHNEFVLIFYEYGVCGLILLLLFVKDIHRRYKECEYGVVRDEILPIYLYFMGILILSIGQFPLHLSRIIYLIPILLAFYYKLTEKHEF